MKPSVLKLYQNPTNLKRIQLLLQLNDKVKKVINQYQQTNDDQVIIRDIIKCIQSFSELNLHWEPIKMKDHQGIIILKQINNIIDLKLKLIQQYHKEIEKYDLLNDQLSEKDLKHKCKKHSIPMYLLIYDKNNTQSQVYYKINENEPTKKDSKLLTDHFEYDQQRQKILSINKNQFEQLWSLYQVLNPRNYKSFVKEFGNGNYVKNNHSYHINDKWDYQKFLNYNISSNKIDKIFVLDDQVDQNFKKVINDLEWSLKNQDLNKGMEW